METNAELWTTDPVRYRRLYFAFDIYWREAYAVAQKIVDSTGISLDEVINTMSALRCLDCAEARFIHGAAACHDHLMFKKSGKYIVVGPDGQGTYRGPMSQAEITELQDRGLTVLSSDVYYAQEESAATENAFASLEQDELRSRLTSIAESGSVDECISATQFIDSLPQSPDLEVVRTGIQARFMQLFQGV